MKKTILFLGVLFLMTGCYNEPQSVTKEGIDFEVEFLFEKDGVKVYRFRDGGRAHYFTTQGETISTIGSKNRYEENIQIKKY